MDRIFRKKEKVVSVSDIERSANFEGNEAILLHKRLQNPKIKRMLVDLILNIKKHDTSKNFSSPH